MAVTIKDVARQAGVSPATVSKVINNRMYVAPQTRERVLEVMQRLNYVPNASAANLARRASKTILYADSFYKGLPYQNPHMFDILCGVSHELSHKGYRLSLLNLDSRERKPKEIIKEEILSHSADGIILNSMYATAQLGRLMQRHGFPQLCIGKPEFDSTLSWIDTNHVLSSNLAVEHLVNGGCQKIAFVGGREGDKIFMDRLRGFRIAMEASGLEVREEWISYNEPDVSVVYHSVLDLLEGPDLPDGLICTSSLMSVGALRAIKRRQLRVPDEISLVAFDDYPYSHIASIPPTVIDIDLFSMGVHAGGLILQKLHNPSMLIQTYTAMPRLIQRGTTRPTAD